MALRTTIAARELRSRIKSTSDIAARGSGKESGINFFSPSAVSSTNELVIVWDPEVGKSNPSEHKQLKLARSLTRGIIDKDLKPSSNDSKYTQASLFIMGYIMHRILKYPPTRTLSGEERQLLWKFRFSLVSDKKALTKFLRSVEWSDAQEAKQAIDLMGRWEMIDVTDALELLSPVFESLLGRNIYPLTGKVNVQKCVQVCARRARVRAGKTASTFENRDKRTSNGCECTSNGYKRASNVRQRAVKWAEKTPGAHLYSLYGLDTPHGVCLRRSHPPAGWFCAEHPLRGCPGAKNHPLWGCALCRHPPRGCGPALTPPAGRGGPPAMARPQHPSQRGGLRTRPKGAATHSQRP
ncbi:hypothetical protein Taro_007354 [Colocasia esculenta]|uniref:PIK helical domain-containing protein n=1 Tax=Colocasia esculenta TaxID=4460 RepID=A0A843TR41_COLES|nr:hypothetical protein [Colocasia esculenta]